MGCATILTTTNNDEIDALLSSCSSQNREEIEIYSKIWGQGATKRNMQGGVGAQIWGDLGGLLRGRVFKPDFWMNR